jgi:hypothetical protein
MKLANIFFKSLGMLILLSSFSSCEKEDLNVLPVESQSGKNTFGCYVDDQLFVRPYPNISWISAAYDRETKSVTINSTSKELGTISIYLTELQINKKNNVNQAGYTYHSKPEVLSNGHTLNYLYSYRNTDSQFVYLTKLDTIKNIISGSFDLELKSEDDSTKTIKLTQGRFDIYLMHTSYP